MLSVLGAGWPPAGLGWVPPAGLEWVPPAGLGKKMLNWSGQVRFGEFFKVAITSTAIMYLYFSRDR